MDNVILEKIIIDSMQLRWLHVCREIKLYFKFNINGRIWSIFYKAVLRDVDYFKLIESEGVRKHRVKKFNYVTRTNSLL